ncbi:MAG: hypothetical protein PHD19_09175 [Dechloromonas sp.]|nr:hypothetical protein [Dechloromonas sp.]
MNAPDEVLLIDPLEASRLACLQRFERADVQNLGRDDLLAAQTLLEHGPKWGYWQTPATLAPGLTFKARDNIDLTARLRDFLAMEGLTDAPDSLIEEGVCSLTRLGVLLRLVPSGTGSAKVRRALKPATISQLLYHKISRIAARAMRRKLESGEEAGGLFFCLTEADQHEFNAQKRSRIELERLYSLAARGQWHDVPALPKIAQTTDPSRAPDVLPPQKAPVPYSPLPDAWLEVIGPRVLWVIQELGPHLLHLLEALPESLSKLDWSLSNTAISYKLQPFIAAHLEKYPWLDRAGRPLTPHFALTTANGKHGADPHEWPPRTHEQIVNLSVILQASHLFISLLACAGRIGELATLKRHCVAIERDGESYLNRHTYKLSPNFLGDELQSPAPPILQTSLGQQARLAAAFDRLPRTLNAGQLPDMARFGDALWVSIGNGGRTGAEAVVNFISALQTLATRLGVNPKPGGKGVHPHRFRKTIGRLAGVALFNSPLVLKRLFGHKSIEMTLHYILCDPGIREEAEKVLRELRIMHCAEALEEIHRAIANNLPLPANGGAGAGRLLAAVENQEAYLRVQGRVWVEGSAYELACLLTGQGKGWRLINANIVCSKDWVCSKPHRHKEQELNKPKCDPGCENRIVLARRRRDTEDAIEQYLEIARQAQTDGQLLVMAHAMENLRNELGYYADLREKYLAMPDVQVMFALSEDTDEPETREVAEAMA